jgi:type III secretion protein L
MSNNLRKRPGGVAEAPRRGALFKRVVVEARGEARRLREEAEREAVALRESAEADARHLYEEARRAGAEDAMRQFYEHLLNARALRDSTVADAERDLLRLAVKIAEKIVGREIERDDETLAHIVAAALRGARRHTNIVVRLNPTDMPQVKSREELLRRLTHAAYFDFVADPGVGRGGCIIESDTGTIDAQLETQLRIIERALLALSSRDRS